MRNFSKYKNVVFNNSDNAVHVKCGEYISDSFEDKYSNFIQHFNFVQPQYMYYKYNTSSSLPVSHYVKEAISCISKYNCKDNSQIRILNKQWDYMSNLLDGGLSDFILPIIDISSSMRKYNDDPLYSAIGFAILVSQHSFLKNRILAIDNVPIWIQLDDNMTFIQKVHTIIKHISSLYSTKASYIQACNLLGKSFLQSSTSHHNIQNIQFVFFSSFIKEPYDSSSLYDTITNTLSEYTITKPHISFWNLSKYDTAQLPCSSNQYDTKLISGYSSHLISHLHNRNKYVSYNPYTTIYDILNKYQYQVLENYVRSVVYM